MAGNSETTTNGTSYVQGFGSKSGDEDIAPRWRSSRLNTMTRGAHHRGAASPLCRDPAATTRPLGHDPSPHIAAFAAHGLSKSWSEGPSLLSREPS